MGAWVVLSSLIAVFTPYFLLLFLVRFYINQNSDLVAHVEANSLKRNGVATLQFVTHISVRIVINGHERRPWPEPPRLLQSQLWLWSRPLLLQPFSELEAPAPASPRSTTLLSGPNCRVERSTRDKTRYEREGVLYIVKILQHLHDPIPLESELLRVVRVHAAIRSPKEHIPTPTEKASVDVLELDVIRADDEGRSADAVYDIDSGTYAAWHKIAEDSPSRLVFCLYVLQQRHIIQFATCV